MPPRNKKTRLDQLMVERGLVETRSLAERLILAGRVRVNHEKVMRPGAACHTEDLVELEAPPPFVSRGGEKLAAALGRFDLSPAGWVCADVGASTGGFTDCLLQRGAARVYAIDVGKGILGWKLRNDPRVIVMEATNARYVESLPESIDLVTIDASFISLKLLLPVAAGWLKPEGQIVALIKPQFEAGRGQVGKGGVVRDAEVHRRVLREVLSAAQLLGFAVNGLTESPLKGPAGNIEFLALLNHRPAAGEWEPLIQSILTK